MKKTAKLKASAFAPSRVKSYVDSSTLQHVMQTVTQWQQGQDKKEHHGTGCKKGGRRTQRLRDSKAGKVQSQMESSD